jgi:Virus neck protein
MTLQPASSCTQSPSPVPSCRLRLNGTTAEQNLLNDLVTESIDIYGQTVYYIPRTLVKEDTLFNEDTMSSFNGAYEIRAYCNTVDGWEGQGDLLSKFGIRIEDKTTFVVSRRRFTEAVDDYADLIVDGRPNEGDLIWAPFSSDLYQITFIEHEKPFYQLGKGYVWEMKCELFQYSHEDLDTGITAVDEIEEDDSYTLDLTFAAGGTGNYTVGEIVTGSTSDAQGEVVSWNPTTRKLVLNNLTGTFLDNEMVVGEDSESSWEVDILDSYNMGEIEGAQNKYFEVKGDLILDFTEENPFGEIGNMGDRF